MIKSLYFNVVYVFFIRENYIVNKFLYEWFIYSLIKCCKRGCICYGIF